EGFNSNFHRAPIVAGTLLCVALALVIDLALILLTRILVPWARNREVASA
ncbi:MAG: hypothetical protein QOI35_3629, partial [Cryptosporangiaceae bacterium]|nr:hypothetical protein [Cryptosporangiaceae bacterium]